MKNELPPLQLKVNKEISRASLFIFLFMLYTIFCIPLHFVHAENPRAFLADYTQIYYNLNNGLPANEVNCVLQTADGYIWVASYAGLERYDGQDFQLMYDADNKPVTRVRELFEDHQHRLWIGTNNNGLYVWENGTITKDIDSVSTTIRAFAESTDGVLYTGSSDGVHLHDQNGKVTPVNDERLKNCMILSLTADATNHIWGVTYRGDVFRLSGSTVDAYYPENTFNGLSCISIYCDNNQRIFVGTTGNVLLHYIDGQFLALSTSDDNNITSITHGSDNKLWLCTDKGLGYFDQQLTYHPTAGALFAISLENMIEDYEHNYWVASSRHGLLHLIKSQFRNISFAGKLPVDVYNATQVYEDNLYLGSENGLVILDKDYNRIENSLTTLLKGIRIRSLYTDSQGALWIATYKKYGLIRYKDNSWQNWTAGNGMPTEKMRTLLERHNGDIAVGTGNGLVIMRNSNIIRIVNAKDELNNGVILSMAEDREGNLYCGSDGGGIYKLDKLGNITNINYTQGVEKLGTILSLCWDDKNDGLWISSGNGLEFMDEKGVHAVKIANLDFNNILDIKLLGDYIWLLQDKGVHILRAKTLSVGTVNDYRYLKYNDTMHSTLTANAKNQLAADGHLYLATSMGVLDLNTQNLNTFTVPVKIVIDSIHVNGLNTNKKFFAPGKEFLLPADTNRITIRFAALTYGNSAPELAYQLKGADKEPTTVHGKKVYETSYTNLPGGTYEFQIQSKTNATLPSSAVINCTIKKKYSPFELRWVQVLLLLTFGVVVAYLASKYRQQIEERRRKAAENKALEEITRRQEYQNLTNQAIHAIAKTIDAKDKYTNGHSVRVAQYAREIAKEEHWSPEQQEKLFYTALLHDIGKIGVPDKILNKPGKLTDEEYAIIKQHTTIGYKILQDMTTIPYIKDGAHYHHEHYDGTGYPEGLKGTDIPEVARLICVADSVDAMYSARIYRPEMTINYIKSELIRCSGTQFDPRFAADMLHILERGFKANDTLEIPDIQEEKFVFENN